MPNPEAEDTTNLTNQLPLYVLKNDLNLIRCLTNDRLKIEASNNGDDEDKVDERICFVNNIPNKRDLREDLSIVEFDVADRPMEMDDEYDMYCSTPTDSDSDLEDDLSEPELQITLQEVPNGVVVNSSCFLPWTHWHTLVPSGVSPTLLQCVVCAEYCDLDTSSHISSSRHKAALAACKPLHKFDLALIRKIRDQYHCAVCNEAFDMTEEFDHFSSKTHEGNLLFAINKTSDILDNAEYNNNTKHDTYQYRHMHQTSQQYDRESVSSDTVHDNINFINFQNNYDDFYEDDIPIVTYETSYATMAKKPKTPVQNFVEVALGDRKVNVRYDSWHMIISPQSNKFWCMICKKYDHLRMKVQHCEEPEHLMNLENCKIVEKYGEYLIRQIISDDKLYHCGHCNNLQWTHEMDEHLETTHPRRTRQVSESKTAKPLNSPAKAKKPTNSNNNTPKKTNTPVINTNNTNNAAINTRINSPTTNTNTNIKPVDKNKLNTAVNTNTVATNTTSSNHPVTNTMDNLSDKYIRDTNSDNIVRSADDSPFLYPNQGAPNNLQTTNNRSTPVNPMQNTVPIINITQNFTNALPTATVIISPFGLKMAVPCLSYNVICRRLHDFYCGLCDMVIPDNAIINHIYDMRHTELLLRIPFITPFSSNLIRAIRDALHCTLCNIPISADQIYIHTKQPDHTTLLQKALKEGKNKNIIELLTANNIRPKVSPNNGGILNPGVGNNFNHFQGFNNNAQGNINNTGLFNNAQVNVGNQTVQEHDATNVQGVFNSIPDIINAQRFDNNSKVKSGNDKEENNTQEVSTETDTNEEYTEIPHRISESDYNDELNDTFDSVASEDATFDLEEYVYLRLKNTYIKITNTSYNTLVHVGDGSRYCFVCAQQVPYIDLVKHVDSRSHLENMEKYRFLDKYEDHLLRQIYMMYHCSICNIILTRRELKTHLDWPPHVLQNDNTLKNIKKTRKTEIKGGIKQIVVSTQKENIYLQKNEPKLKILLNANVVNEPQNSENDIEASAAEMGGAKKNKIIIFNDNVLKIAWENWHGILKAKNGYKCILCQRELIFEDVDLHCDSEWHRYGLDKPFEKQHAPALVRKITEATLNCLICNTEVSNRQNIISEHISGKKHLKNYDAILKDSSMANTYTDCHDDVLML